MRRVFFLAQAELLHVIRDRATLVQVLVVPMVQILILANAATFEIRDTRTAIADADNEKLRHGPAFNLELHLAAAGINKSVARQLGDCRGNARLILIIEAKQRGDLARPLAR